MVKKILMSFGSLLTFAPLSMTVACGQEQTMSKTWDASIIINMKVPWADVDTQAWVKALEAKANELKNAHPFLKSHDDFHFALTQVNDDDVIVQNVSAKKTDLGIASISAINQGDHHYLPRVQTLTTKFVWDHPDQQYLDGSDNDPLRQMAMAENAIFHERSFNQWSSGANFEQWNGSIYEKFYNILPQRVTDSYRGNIWIQGSPQEMNQIKAAWNNKDWSAFRKFGIISGPITSGGQFLLQQNLLQQHFSKNGVLPFATLAQERVNHADDFLITDQRASTLGSDQQYHIAFDDDGSFAWTSNDNHSDFFHYDQNQLLEILSLTNSLRYDIGVFQLHLPESEIKIISDALTSLANEKLDLYGPALGYSGGYRYINPYEAIESIYNEWQQSMSN